MISNFLESQMADSVSGATAPAAATPISFTEHPIDYVVAKVAAAIDSFSSETVPAAPAAVARSAPPLPTPARYGTSFADCDTTIVGFSRCR